MIKITDPNFYEELEFCKECDHYGEPNGCNRKGGACSAYFVFVDAYGRLCEYENMNMTPSEIMALRAERDLLVVKHDIFIEGVERIRKRRAERPSVLTLDEVIGLPDDTKVFVEYCSALLDDMSNGVSTKKNGYLGVEYAIVDDEGRYWDLKTDGTEECFGESYRVWYPGVPSYEDMDAVSW